MVSQGLFMNVGCDPLSSLAMKETVFSKTPYPISITSQHLISIHRHPLRVSAELAICRRANWAARVSDGAALLECKKLLGAEALVVDLRCRLDEIL